MTVLFVNADDGFVHKASANAALYPNVGLLTLMSSLVESLANAHIDASVEYLDGCVHSNQRIERFIIDNQATLKIVCFGCLTSNYGASLRLAEYAKAHIVDVVTIFGNDHFSALYKKVMEKRKVIDFGFYGNDVVFGFSTFVRDVLTGQRVDLENYAGLVYRSKSGEVCKNPENPSEYNQLPLVDYGLCDVTLPHSDKYLAGQRETYWFMKDRGLSSQIIDIGRGCIKFSGKRMNNIPLNACDFCGIIPGAKSVLPARADVAWEKFKNAHDQGFNYFYITADELPLTFWPLLKNMASSPPNWFLQLSAEERPKMFGYARAEAFERQPEKIDVLVDLFGFDHFFIGFDGLSDISLKAMNKQSTLPGSSYGLMQANIDALKVVADKGCLITAGIVLTHIGITEDMMEKNFQNLEKMVDANHSLFAALDFGPLCPIPGSQSFQYFLDPDFAQLRADKFDLSIDYEFLSSVQKRYQEQDVFDNEAMIDDFLTGCCPEIDRAIVNQYMEKITALAQRHNIVVGGGV